ncbi:hypothetical protein ACFQZJ_09215 [Maribacter chungangensis]|uniref:Uncharacterized protein n=1 Tax=Maribacter chungangensis TaxID=1069117 RepID=A0ABW3B4V9_9FLAO
MHYLNQDIAALTKRKKTPSLVKPESSCGIFQDVEKLIETKVNRSEKH